MRNKDFRCSIKNFDDVGTAQAVFATMGTVDKDGDYTESGAFGRQTAKLMGAHDWSAPPIGLATIHERGNEAVADFKFNLEMDSAREWYQLLDLHTLASKAALTFRALHGAGKKSGKLLDWYYSNLIGTISEDFRDLEVVVGGGDVILDRLQREVRGQAATERKREDHLGTEHGMLEQLKLDNLALQERLQRTRRGGEWPRI